MKTSRWIAWIISCMAALAMMVLLPLPTAAANEMPVPRSFDTLCTPQKGERSVPIYSQPKTSSDKLMTLGEGETLTVIGDTGKFYLVDADGQHGYVVHEYVKLSGAPGAEEIAEALDDKAALVDPIPFRKETHRGFNGPMQAYRKRDAGCR